MNTNYLGFFLRLILITPFWVIEQSALLIADAFKAIVRYLDNILPPTATIEFTDETDPDFIAEVDEDLLRS